jgi:hypothetical protein
MANSPTFTARDMNRQPAAILAAAERYGSVKIRRRDGREFTLAACVEPGPAKPKKLPDFDALYRRHREAGFRPPRPSERQRLNRLIDRTIAGQP